MLVADCSGSIFLSPLEQHWWMGDMVLVYVDKNLRHKAGRITNEEIGRWIWMLELDAGFGCWNWILKLNAGTECWN